MKTINRLVVSSLIGLALAGCAMHDNDIQLTTTTPTAEATDQRVLGGVVRVKFTEETARSFSREAGDNLRSTGNNAIDAYLAGKKVKSITRTFPNRGKYEERRKKAGLHLWYDITFEDESTSATESAQELSGLRGISVAETVRVIPTPNETATIVDPAEVLRSARSSNGSIFNDPLLGGQWHYKNEAKYIRHKEGADINLYKAWEVETGKPEVVVAVVDAGIDLEHEDLKDNIYTGATGWNFVTDTDKINAGAHGTHVAGTVAARSNNGVGVAGVAGGNGTAESGIKMMSCQVFDVDPRTKRATQAKNFGAALVYAADNGAVIAQNSWGYGYPGPTSLDASLQAAIDYFIINAGCDENGNQRSDSPMKGGVVIFAAGNDGVDYISYPGAYDKVISVASMAPDFTRAEYTTHGSWVDITAPGGSDYFEQGGVLSTLPGNKYGRMQGTSMACPHVSGIAALIVSKYGGQGFTNEELKNRLLNSLLPQSINSNNPTYSGKLGYGYIDAFAALAENKRKAPEAVASVATTADFSELQLSYTAVRDEDDNTASTYKLYVSKTPITASNLDQLTPMIVPAHHYKAGDAIKYSLNNLDFDQAYYFAIVSVDRWGLSAAPYFFSAKTKENRPATLTTSVPVPVRVAVGETKTFVVKVADPDGKDWTFSVDGDNPGVSYERSEEGILFRVKGIAPATTYKIQLKVLDHFFAKTELSIPVEIYVNAAPKQTKNFETLYLGTSPAESKTIDLSTFFSDDDEITYKAVSRDPEYLTSTVSGKTLTLSSLGKKGNSVVQIEAIDSFGNITKVNLAVRLVESNFVYNVFPVPTSRELNLIVRDGIKTIDVEVRTPNGILSLKKSIPIAEGASRQVKLDVSSLPIGTYVLSVKSGNDSYRTTFSKI